jgi:hypothetical protein
MAYRDSRGSLGRMSAGRMSRKFDSVIEGMMEKLSSKKKWQKRYFVLTDLELVYYDNNKKSSKMREVMTLDSVSKVEMVEVGTSSKKSYEVQITCGNNFPYPLRTSSREEADQWLDALLNTLQDNNARNSRNSTSSMKSQQDMMMQVAMAMNMGLQMGMQNNMDSNGQSIYASTVGSNNSYPVAAQPTSEESSSEDEDPTSDFVHAIVNDAINDVDSAIGAGERKATDAVDKALAAHNRILDNALDDAESEQISPAELAEDAGVDLTTSFANFYNDAFGEFTEESLSKQEPLEGEHPVEAEP